MITNKRLHYLITRRSLVQILLPQPLECLETQFRVSGHFRAFGRERLFRKRRINAALNAGINSDLLYQRLFRGENAHRRPQPLECLETQFAFRGIFALGKLCFSGLSGCLFGGSMVAVWWKNFSLLHQTQFVKRLIYAVLRRLAAVGGRSGGFPDSISILLYPPHSLTLPLNHPMQNFQNL